MLCRRWLNADGRPPDSATPAEAGIPGVPRAGVPGPWVTEPQAKLSHSQFLAVTAQNGEPRAADPIGLSLCPKPPARTPQGPDFISLEDSPDLRLNALLVRPWGQGPGAEVVQLTGEGTTEKLHRVAVTEPF